MKNKLLMNNLSYSLNNLTKEIKNKKVIYIDYPVHHNIGDHLIYLGALRLLKQGGFKIVSQLSVYSYTSQRLEKLIKKYNGNVTIVLHGGGNFGDLYESHQNCRLDIIYKFQDVNIVLFPQTIFYKDKNKLLEHQKITAAHPNLSFFVRDKNSLSMASLLCKNSYLSPDTAHKLWQNEKFLGIKKTTKNNKLNFRRRDIESKEKSKTGFDWEDLITQHDIKFKDFLIKYNSRYHSELLNWVLCKLWGWQSLLLCRKAAKYFVNFNQIETDRLHGHILSSLLDIENKVHDNSYGKNYAYISQWTEQSTLTSCENDV